MYDLLAAPTNVVVLAIIPFALYSGVLSWVKKVPGSEVVARTGLQWGETRYVGYSLGMAVIIVVVLLIWPPSAEYYAREGSAFRRFAGAGVTGSAIIGALLYGIVQTGSA
jgi:hypothetical protein